MKLTKRNIPRLIGRLAYPLACVALPLLVAGCDIDDERDLCCDPVEGLWMNYRYIYQEKDVFPQYINDLEHYLFDADGNFAGTVAPGRRLTQQELKLRPGTYTMVTLGNRDHRQSLENHVEEGLDGFILRALSQEELPTRAEPGADFRIGELYGGFCRFTVKGDVLETYTTYMSNIHCQLDMTVTWESVAPVGNFRIELSNVPSHYHMGYDRKNVYQGYDFPADHGLRDTYNVVVPQQYQRLSTTFVTLRYTSECVPVVKIFNEAGEQITPDLDLEKVFQSWNWIPEDLPVQHYKINIEIRKDGSVVITPGFETMVLDWVVGNLF